MTRRSLIDSAAIGGWRYHWSGCVTRLWAAHFEKKPFIQRLITRFKCARMKRGAAFSLYKEQARKLFYWNWTKKKKGMIKSARLFNPGGGKARAAHRAAAAQPHHLNSASNKWHWWRRQLAYLISIPLIKTVCGGHLDVSGIREIFVM